MTNMLEAFGLTLVEREEERDRFPLRDVKSSETGVFYRFVSQALYEYYYYRHRKAFRF